MSIKVTTQYLENYGIEEDGNYWKFKWGSTYIVGGTDDRPANAVALVQARSGYVNAGSIEFVRAWEHSDEEPTMWFDPEMSAAEFLKGNQGIRCIICLGLLV